MSADLEPLVRRIWDMSLLEAPDLTSAQREELVTRTVLNYVDYLFHHWLHTDQIFTHHVAPNSFL